MKNPLDNPWQTLGLGLVLTVVLAFLARYLMCSTEAITVSKPAMAAPVEFILRWLHFLFGILWIGLLYYFNLVQVPALKVVGADAKGELFKEGSLVRTALFYFRWAAVGTVVVGLLLMYFNSNGAIERSALMLKGPYAGLGIGAWLGIIMMINVWGFIWRNQKKVLGIVEATPEEKTKAGRIALLASRTNFMLSVPMLFFMEAGSHPFGSLFSGNC